MDKHIEVITVKITMKRLGMAYIAHHIFNKHFDMQAQASQ
jgi:urease accessory protein UreE